MIVVTGAGGFIGSCLVSRLNAEGFTYIVAVDDFSRPEKLANITGKKIREQVDRRELFGWLEKKQQEVEFVFHIGARTDTAEFDMELLNELNLHYSQRLWTACAEYQLPLIYASSAATYGLGELGYQDDETLIPRLQPLNPYGVSKNEFDKWVLQQTEHPFFWAGFKFFNVYGPNEYHKGRMASVIFHAYNQIRQTGGMKLFRSHNPEYADGEQRRDFIYVKDLLEVLLFFMYQRRQSGIYNLGTGKARTFLDLTRGTFRAMGIPENISFVDTPADIRDKYQYFTEADMAKVRAAGYTRPFTTLEEGITDYVGQYLQQDLRLF